jgi:hypothetical protein
MKRLIPILLFCVSLSAQTISSGPQQNYDNVIQITNNTVPTLTNPNPSGGTYGRFVQAYYVYSGPCIHSGAIKTFAVTSGHGGTGYVTGDTGTVDGGSTLAAYTVTASSGVVTGITMKLPTFSAPFGSAYSTGTGIATTATSGSGIGLEININSVYTADAGPNCLIVEDQNKNRGWATAAGQSVTFARVSPASSAINGTFNTIYQTNFHQYNFSIAMAGSGQTPGFYILTPTGGGGGSGNSQAVNVPSTGTRAGTATQIQPIWDGFGYTSCPTLTMPSSAGGTPATFSCLDGSVPAWAFDTSLAAGTAYYQLATGNVSGGMAQDSTGATWAVFARSYPNQINQGVSYLAIRKSTDGGHTWGTEQPFVYDGMPGAFAHHCGPGGNTLPCSYVTGAMATAPNGDLVMSWWELRSDTAFFDNGGRFGIVCCFVRRCTPTAVDCTLVANWTSDYQVPVTTANSPNGVPYNGSIAMTSSWFTGDMALGLDDRDSFLYIVTSCDNGATWGTGKSCTAGENTFINVKATSGVFSGAMPTQEFFMGCYANCSIPASATLIEFGRNNIEGFSGGVGKCLATQPTCGPPLFGFSTNGGRTWKIAQSSLTPFHGPMTTGEYGTAGTYLLKAPNGNYWTVMWIERDQLPGANLYVIASTIDPGLLISNLSANWTNANLESLWYYTVNPEPSSPWATLTTGNNIAYFWVGGPGNNELDTFWPSSSNYSFPAVSGGPIIIQGRMQSAVHNR